MPQVSTANCKHAAVGGRLQVPGSCIKAKVVLLWSTKTQIRDFDLSFAHASPFKHFIVNHDDSWVFTLLYVGLAVTLSMYISMFWLIVVAFVHGAFEWASLRLKGEYDGLVVQVCWHLRLDIVLIVFALWLGVYIDVIFGALGLGAVARGGAQVGSRVLAWQRTVRGALLTLDDVVQVLKAIVVSRSTKAKEPESASGHAEGFTVSDKGIAWGKADVVLVLTGVLLAASVIAAPLLTEMEVGEVLDKVAGDLHPWP